MGLILAIVIGALAGWFASMIMGRDSQMGTLANIVVGIVGAFIAGWIFGLLGYDRDAAGLIGQLFTATVGAVVLLAIVNLFTTGRVR